MKNIFIICLVALAAIVHNGCDKIDPPYIKNNTVAPPDTTNDTITLRKVLVEDFTGHKCGYCPRATREIYDLKQIYGDRLISISVHAGFFASTNLPPFTYDFKCATGVELDNDFGVSAAGNPNGLVNRKQVNGNYIVSYTSWASEIDQVLSNTDPAAVRIDISTAYDSSSRQLDAEVQLTFNSTLNGSHRLSVYLVEDSIVNWQKDYDATPNDNPNYVHREVLRGSMNGTYGDAVLNTSAGTTESSGFTTTLNTGWNAENMSLVVFVYDEATKEIVQVEQKHLE